MIKYFRINDPYRLIGILLLLVLMRLPFLIASDTLTIPELNWMLIGEKTKGNQVLYADLKDHIAPLAARAYSILDWTFGRSALCYQLLGMLLVFFQAALFNSMLINNKAYNENTYVPALIYIISACAFFDLSTLSPELMSLTFILLAFNNIYVRMENKVDDFTILKTGLFLGIAMHFYFASGLFIIASVLALLLFTNTVLRRYLLLLYGIALPFLVSGLFYHWNNTFHDYIINFLFGAFITSDLNYLSLKELLFIGLVPLVTFFFALLVVFQTPRFTNYQQRLQQTMFIVGLVALLILLFDQQKASHVLIIFVPTFAFFVTHYLLLIKKKWVLNTLFFSYLIGTQLMANGTFFNWPYLSDLVEYKNQMASESEYEDLVKGKKVLLLDQDLRVYKNAYLATPYLNWNLAKIQLAEPEYYDNIQSIYRNFKKDMPDVIIDPNGVMPSIFAKIPPLAVQYKHGPNTYIYLRQ